MKKEGGVSPVIATILMVAITVVLAMSVYLAVTGYMLGSPYSTSKLVGSLTELPSKSTKHSIVLKIELTKPEKTLKDKVTITIVDGGKVTSLKYSFTSHVWTNATTGGKWHYEANLTDLDGDGYFSDGDVITVYTVDDNPADSIYPPPFHSGEKIVFSISDFHGTSTGGDIEI